MSSEFELAPPIGGSFYLEHHNALVIIHEHVKK